MPLTAEHVHSDRACYNCGRHHLKYEVCPHMTGVVAQRCTDCGHLHLIVAPGLSIETNPAIGRAVIFEE